MNPNLSVLINELQNRARIYVHIYRELSKEIGREKTIEVLKRALYARGREKGAQLKARIGKPDLHKKRMYTADMFLKPSRFLTVLMMSYLWTRLILIPLREIF